MSANQELLLISDIIGPATGYNAGHIQRALDNALLGRIEVQRRRITRDGRIKLKLTLLGVAVDKCGVCLSQFREEGRAFLLQCQHA